MQTISYANYCKRFGLKNKVKIISESSEGLTVELTDLIDFPQAVKYWVYKYGLRPIPKILVVKLVKKINQRG